MPLDSFVEHPAARMEVIGKPKEMPPVQAEVQKVDRRGRGQVLADGLDRTLRLLRAGQAGLCVIVTGERRFYGCFIFKKGVIPPGA